MVTAVLAGIAVAALGIAGAVLASQSGNRTTIVSDAHWSSWVPGNSGNTGITEIAQFVSPYYRLSAAKQLDVITPISWPPAGRRWYHDRQRIDDRSQHQHLR